ncbi:MAG: c-type cytochrome, partial [Gammaproteobacteria bacterium]|nr:c-type cytochrome [Gammaproteobacteria bacterium]
AGSDTITVRVTDRTAPTAAAGADQTVNEGATVTLDGRGSSNAAGVAATGIGYAWTRTDSNTPAVSLANPNTAQPTFTAPDVATAVIYTFSLVVTQTATGVASAADAVSVTVNDDDAPSVTIDGGARVDVAEGATHTFGASVTDGGNTVLTYAWSVAAGGGGFNDAASATPIYTAPAIAAAGTARDFTVTLMVTDGQGNEGSDTIAVRVADQTVPTAAAGADQTVNEGATVTLDGRGSSNAAGVAATGIGYAWTRTDSNTPAVSLANPNTAQPTFTAPDVATAVIYTFSLVVTQTATGVASAADTVNVTVNDVPALDGQALYTSNGCGNCHGTGVLGAPILGNAADWTARIARGTSSLYNSAINGRGVMPARGGSSASDAELRAIVDYMVGEASP